MNTPFAKNMVGTFAQPDGVLIDPTVLETLGKRELIEGMGEVIKYGLIEDPELWDLLSDMDGSVESILEHSESLIEHSCQVKRKMVVEDELDNGIRLYLNFGHTIGHAIEATAGYGKVMHGEAVAMGMVQVSKVAEEKGLMPAGITQSIREMCQKFGLPVDYENWDVDKLYQALTHDKKSAWQYHEISFGTRTWFSDDSPSFSRRNERLLSKIRRMYEIFNSRRITWSSSDSNY